jgi:hypothetical protein
MADAHELSTPARVVAAVQNPDLAWNLFDGPVSRRVSNPLRG